MIKRVRNFTSRLIAKNIRNMIPSLVITLTPLGWITALLSGLQLFGARGLRNLLNPLWSITLANLFIKKLGEKIVSSILAFKEDQVFSEWLGCGVHILPRMVMQGL